MLAWQRHVLSWPRFDVMAVFCTLHHVTLIYPYMHKHNLDKFIYHLHTCIHKLKMLKLGQIDCHKFDDMLMNQHFLKMLALIISWKTENATWNHREQQHVASAWWIEIHAHIIQKTQHVYSDYMYCWNLMAGKPTSASVSHDGLKINKCQDQQYA